MSTIELRKSEDRVTAADRSRTRLSRATAQVSCSYNASEVSPAVVTLDLAPQISLGPLELAWHGIMIAVSLLFGLWLALRLARERGLAPQLVMDAVLTTTLAGIVGARLYYLVQADPGALLQPGDWLGTRGFAFYGAILLGVPAVALLLWRRRAGIGHLDVLALAFPAAMAVGRVGDLISGEHYGERSDGVFAFAYTHPDAEVPVKRAGYESGAFYEIASCALIAIVLWPLRHRFRTPGVALWTVIGLYAAARFAFFFAVRDTPEVALGLRQAQWTSLALIATAAAGLLVARRRAGRVRDRATAPA